MKSIIDAYALALDALLPVNRQKLDNAVRDPQKQYRRGEKRW